MVENFEEITPKLKNYFLFSGIFLIFLAALFFPKKVSYVSWISNSIFPDVVTPSTPLFLPVSPVISEFIGKTFIWFFFLLPLIFLIFFVKRFISKQEGGKIFFKLPGVILLISILCSLLILYFGGFEGICSGEGCLGLWALAIIMPIIWLFVSIPFCFFVNKKSGGLSKLLNLAPTSLKTFFAIFSIITVIFLLGSMINFYFLLGKLGNSEEANFFKEFPEFHEFDRTNVGSNFDGKTTYGSPGIQNYSTVYFQGYSTCLSAHRGDNCYTITGPTSTPLYDYRDYEVLVYSFNTLESLEKSLNQTGINSVNGQIRSNEIIPREEGGMEGYTLSFVNLEGCEIALFNNTKSYENLVYLWVSKTKKYLFHIESKALNESQKSFDTILIKKLLEKYGC